MVRIPVYEYVCSTSHGAIRVATFRPRPGPGHRLDGTIVAPEGTEVRDSGGGVVKLKVPKTGRPGEAWVMVADDARAAARKSADGLAWEAAEAAQAVPR